MGIDRFAVLKTALLAAFAGVGAADVVTYDWRVTAINAAFDGVMVPTLGINDKPADQALIDVEMGQEVEVRVTNELHEPTCLHWHGLKQLGTQEMDGSSDITQCHIEPNATAIYRFTPDKPGTFWWHSHHGKQYAFGLRGPLVVHAPALEQQQSLEHDVDEEFVIQMGEVYHKEPYPTRMWDSMVINNRGRYNCSAAAAHGWTNCTDDQPLSRFQFVAGKKYLLRLINMAALSPIKFSIDDHEFRVVAADAEPLEPSKPMSAILLNCGQRYDVVVQAKEPTQTPGQPKSYWMRAIGLHDLPWTRGTAETAGVGYNYEGLGIVSYDPVDTIEPTTNQTSNSTFWNEMDFTPKVQTTLPKIADDRMVLEFKMENGLGHFAIDGGDYHHFLPPKDPPLFSIAGGLKTEELPPSTNARKVEYGKHIEAVLVNIKDEQHPFHMHTHTPWVVGSGHASIEDIRNNNLPPLKLDGPVARDVYTVPECTSDGTGGCLDAGYLVLRFTADNPGVWIFHCHIDWHLDSGLAMVLVEGEEELQKRGVESFANSMLSVCGSNSNSTWSNVTVTH